MKNQVTIASSSSSTGASDSGFFSLSNGIDIYWGLEAHGCPNTRAEAEEIASFLCKALNEKES